jgi:hypothetical protein
MRDLRQSLGPLVRIRGELTESVDVAEDEVARALIREVRRQGAEIVSAGPNHLRFSNPLWNNMSYPGWYALTPFDRGIAHFRRAGDGIELRYELSTLHGFVFCLSVAAAMALFGAAFGSMFPLKFALFAFAWLYGGNFAIGLVRSRDFFRRVVRGAAGKG